MTCCLIDSQLVLCSQMLFQQARARKGLEVCGSVWHHFQHTAGEAGGFRLVSESYSKVFQTHLWTVDLSRSFWDRDSSNDELIVLWDPRAFWSFGITKHLLHQTTNPKHHFTMGAEEPSTTVPSTAPAPPELPRLWCATLRVRAPRAPRARHSGSPPQIWLLSRSLAAKVRSFCVSNMGKSPVNINEWRWIWNNVRIYEQNIFIL